jgi:hypothetical protein
MTTIADRCRALADDCGKQAEKATSPQDRARWLKNAKQWLDLAQEAEGPRVRRVESPAEKTFQPANNPSDWDHLMARALLE